MRENVKITPVYGSVFSLNPIVDINDDFIRFPGEYQDAKSVFHINEEILSKHLMLLGGTGSGKTNTFYHIVSQLKKKLSKDDVMIIFDTKGDYYKRFFNNSDIVLGNSVEYRNSSVKWNIFREILSDGWDQRLLETNCQEIAGDIFQNAISKNNTNSFFPNAAKDLFATLLMCFFYKGESDIPFRHDYYFNSELKRALSGSNIHDLVTFITNCSDNASVLSYISEDAPGQALGVYSELQSVFRKLFVGVFSEQGDFSIRNFVRNQGGKTLFIEYDLAIGNVLSPMYSLLFDVALKEALGRKNKNGNVYLICDEFKLLPNLQHIEDAVNYGRSLGVKVIAGLQSIEQLFETYGENQAKSILSGFSSIIAFKLNDPSSRTYISDLYGKNYICEQYSSLSNSINEDRHSAQVVEDWDINGLRIGEALVGLPHEKPFKYKFDLF